MIRKNTPLSLLLFLALCLFGCKKKDHLGFDGLVFGPSVNAQFDALESHFIRINDAWVLGEQATFPVKLTKPFNRDVKIKLVIEPSLAKLYDSVKDAGRIYPPIPKGALQLLNGGIITVKAGQTQSLDSVRILEKNTSLLVMGVTYLVPIVIVSTDSEVPIDYTKNITFLKLTTGASLNAIGTLEGAGLFTNSLRRISMSSQPSGINTIYLRGFNQIPAPFDQQLEAVANPAGVNQYNSKNGTAYSTVPDHSFTLVQNKATIYKGATYTTDSFSVQLPDLSLFDAQKQYVLPIELKSVTGGGFTYPMDSLRKMVYILISTTVSNVNPDNPVVSGVAIDRSSWTVSESAHFSSHSAALIKDGSYTTSWFAPFSASDPAWISIDMGSVKNIKGFMFTPQFVYQGYVPTGITVQISSDGKSWMEVGKYAGNATIGTTANPMQKYISFFEALSSRYFRFLITKSSTPSYSGISEISAYE